VSERANSRLKVVLCWHMHQPEYRDAATGQYQLPWTYLHAIKDYVDMVAILEQVPNARAVVNFVPILLEQIDDYAHQVSAFLSDRTNINDPLLSALAEAELPSDDALRCSLVNACLRANEERLINRFDHYRQLVDIAANIKVDETNIDYLSDQYLTDLLVWYHLAWLGETVRRTDKRVKGLIKKGRLYTGADRLQLMQVIGELLSTVIQRYRVLSERGQIELSMTPYAHPMIPLLEDFSTASEAVPDIDLPVTQQFTGGTQRGQWHMRYGLEIFKRYFAVTPSGCWPAEGGVSDGMVKIMADHDIKWFASGESVLRNSLARAAQHDDRPIEDQLHRAYRIDGSSPIGFFRDDGLSDLIGFTYSGWHGDDAVSNMVNHLENIAQEYNGDEQRVVSIILDGENAWESYPENAYHFLTALYTKLSDNALFELTTFSDCIAQGVEPGQLPSLVAGSWVYGSFTTWIGDQGKNRAWDLLCDAKQAFDEVMASGNLSDEQTELAIQQLAVCEGSDWFWWFGDYNPGETVRDFDRLYRGHLRNLYSLIGRHPPQVLDNVISAGAEADVGEPAQGGVMRQGKENH